MNILHRHIDRGVCSVSIRLAFSSRYIPIEGCGRHRHLQLSRSRTLLYSGFRVSHLDRSGAHYWLEHIDRGGSPPTDPHDDVAVPLGSAIYKRRWSNALRLDPEAIYNEYEQVRTELGIDALSQRRVADRLNEQVLLDILGRSDRVGRGRGQGMTRYYHLLEEPTVVQTTIQTDSRFEYLSVTDS